MSRFRQRYVSYVEKIANEANYNDSTKSKAMQLIDVNRMVLMGFNPKTVATAALRITGLANMEYRSIRELAEIGGTGRTAYRNVVRRLMESKKGKIIEMGLSDTAEDLIKVSKAVYGIGADEVDVFMECLRRKEVSITNSLRATPLADYNEKLQELSDVLEKLFF